MGSRPFLERVNMGTAPHKVERTHVEDSRGCGVVSRSLTEDLQGIRRPRAEARSLDPGPKSQIRIFDTSIFGSGKRMRSESKVSAMICETARSRNHLWSAGMMYHGAQVVLHRLRASS